PGRLVKTLAYGWSLTPPEGMELRDNAVVMFCAGGSFFHPIATDPKRAALREAMAGWGAIAKHRDVYLYFPHHDYWFPAPCTLAGGDNIRWCHDAGADNAYAAVSGWSNWFGSESVHLRAWVYARMLWDPTLEIQPLVDEFIADYYGPAAEVVAEAFRIVHDDIFDDTGALRVCNDSAVAPEFVDPVKMRAINRLFEDAYGQLPEGDYRERLEFAWLPYLWADFWLGFSGFGRYDRDARTWSVPLEDGALRNAYGARFKRLAIKHGVEALGELKKLEPHSLGLDKAGVPWPAHLVTGGTSEAVVVPGVGGHIVDYRDARTGFAPLKEAWRGLALQYPNFTTTEEKINGTPVGEYAVVAASPESVDLRADLKNCVVGKSVRFEGDTLHSDVSVEATAAGPLHCTSCVMFDLQDSVFGPHPTLYTERTDGTWTARDLGAETDFWWVEGNLDIANATGRMVLARQDRPEGVMFTFEPDQIGNLYHWYDRYWVGPEDQCKMLRFFLNSPTVEAQAGDAVRVNWSVRILEDARSVVKGE
ncbi:MAG: DUF4838 domain-containing protein, partial [bacterium]|nr:DUF4838 domain-containing protein [bacterium]